MAKTAYLVLENGDVYEGYSFGAEKEVTGELVFTTSMVGYLETLTDPRYHGQLVVQTFPLTGNYGVISTDLQSPCAHPGAYIVREFCDTPSNFRCEGTLETYFNEQGIPGLYGIDTRRLTKTLCNEGAMNAFLTTDAAKVPEGAAICKAYSVGDVVSEVSSFDPYETVEDGERTVAFWDFGAPESLSRALVERGCKVVRLPAATTAEELLSYDPDGILVGNGPGDPAANTAAIAELTKLTATGLPIFGVGLGHQLLALSMGAKTEKLHHGHRGANQPVKDLSSGRVAITAQNHGYTVLPDSLPEGAVETHINANDGSLEGISYEGKPMFSLQFDPAVHGSLLDSETPFDRFIALIDAHRA